MSLPYDVSRCLGQRVTWPWSPPTECPRRAACLRHTAIGTAGPDAVVSMAQHLCSDEQFHFFIRVEAA